MSTTQENSADQSKNVYPADAESELEMARLMRQDQLLTRGMGGIFPEKPDLSNVQCILDVACGPGGWVLDTAYSYADMEVTGVDISERMITYANAQAEAQHRSNAHFKVMDMLQPFTFPDASFDLVNARLVAAAMHRDKWPGFFAECLRILRPGGILRVTEFEWGMSNKPYHEEACHKIHQALSRMGHNFSPTGLHYGVIPMLPRLFRNAGLQHISTMAHLIDYSFDMDGHEGFYHDYAVVLGVLEPLVVHAQVATADEWHELVPKALAEMQDEDFCAVWTTVTVWGNKPE